MEKKYVCTNPQCGDNEKDAYVKVVNQESVMDEQNMAQMFCPKCKSRLESPKEETPATC
ncbi:MAG: hypothetical protein HUN04_19110 [Desulfobacter sp.]|nr:MAG: hypothetical protein HUN04_19110 [Desulfobacter sp.]